MDLSNVLGEVFGTTKTASAHTEEDLLNEANFAFFEGLAKEAGVDLSKLSDQELVDTFTTTMQKVAESEDKPPFPPKKDDEKDEEKKEAEAKVAQARAEFQEKRAAAVKVAEAEAMGRIMAHAYVDELRKIAADMEGGKPPFPPKKDDEKKDDEEKNKEASASARLLAAFESTKQASAPAGVSSTPAFDEFAAYKAIDMLKEAGVDGDFAFKAVDVAFTRGLPESTKMASAQNEDTALHYRALEIAEAAGFNVDWSKA